MIYIFVNEEGNIDLKQTIQMNIDKKRRLVCLLNGVKYLRYKLEEIDDDMSYNTFRKNYLKANDSLSALTALKIKISNIVLKEMKYCVEKTIVNNERAIERGWEKLLK